MVNNKLVLTDRDHKLPSKEVMGGQQVSARLQQDHDKHQSPSLSSKSWESKIIRKGKHSLKIYIEREREREREKVIMKRNMNTLCS